MKFDNPHVRPGQKVYVEYNDYQSSTVYTVAGYAGHKIVIEVPKHNKDGSIEGWSALSKPDFAKEFNLSADKYYWFIWNWRLASNMMEIDNPNVKPGDYVRIFYNSEISETSFKVAAVCYAGRIIVEVGAKNLKDSNLAPGWYGRERPLAVIKYNLNPSKKYWWVSDWTFLQNRRLDT